MTQEQINFQVNAQIAASKKGWFLAFLLKQVIPFIIEHWDDIFPKSKVNKLMSDDGVTPPPPLQD